MRFLRAWHNDKTASGSCIKTHCWSCKCEEGLCELWIVIALLILCLHCPRAAMCPQKSLAEPILATNAAAQGTWLLSAVVGMVTLHSSVVLSSQNCCHFSSAVTSGDFHQDKAYEEHMCTSLFSKSWSHSISWLAGEKGERSCKIQRASVSAAVPFVYYTTLLSQGRRVSLNSVS